MTKELFNQYLKSHHHSHNHIFIMCMYKLNQVTGQVCLLTHHRLIELAGACEKSTKSNGVQATKILCAAKTNEPLDASQ